MKEKINNIKNAFPAYLSQDIDKLYQSKNLLNFRVNENPQYFAVLLNNEGLKIPYQISLIDEDDFNISTEKHILDCYLTRHYEPLIREKHFHNIRKLNSEWVIPYIFLLLGHSGVETLNIIYDELKNFNPEMYKNFIKNNTSFYNLIQSRVASYYGRYYPCYIPREKNWHRRNYVGFKILKFINNNFLL
jgi:hypothetical protein